MRSTKGKRREEILEAATKLFSEHGYQDTDIQAIADAIDVGKGTIYLYFPSKEALFFATVNRAMTLVEAFVRKRVISAKDTVSLLKEIVRAYVEFFRKHPHFVELFVQERAVFRFRNECSYMQKKEEREAKWAALFEKLLTQGKLRFKNIPRIISTIHQLFYGVIFTNIFQTDEASFETRMNEGIDMMLFGILLPEEVV